MCNRYLLTLKFVAVAVVIRLCAQQSPAVADVLVYPGDPPDKVVVFLTAIADQYDANQAVLKNLRLVGRISEITVRVDPSKPMVKNTGDMPPPAWQNFQLTYKDGKRRLDQDFRQATSDGPMDIKLARLFDGETQYKLDGLTLAIDAIEDPEFQWMMGSAHSVFKGQLIRDYAKYSTVSILCRNHIDRIKGLRDVKDGRPFFEHSGMILTCETDGNLATIRLAGGAYLAESHLDASKGFLVVSSQESTGKPTGALYFRQQSENSIREIAPGVYFPMMSSVFTSSLGSTLAKEGVAGWHRTDVNIQGIEFGDFDVEHDYFSPSTLKVPVGTLVADRRRTPQVSFTHGRAPITNEILEQSLAQRGGATSVRVRAALIVLNVAIVIALTVFLVRRRASGV